MNKMKSVFTLFSAIFFALSIFACAQQTKPAPAAAPFPAQQIADYIRKAFNVPPAVSINVKQSNSDVPGLQGITIELTGQGQTQTRQAWITSDSKKLILGNSFDLSVDPYKKNWAMINFANVPTTGASSAKVTIVEYSDFQCPYCSRAHKTIQDVLKQYDGKVKLLYKHLPLNIHPWAEDAAIDASCVYEQNNDAFWKLADFLFTNQGTITKDNLKEKVMTVAQESKLDSAKLETCMTNRTSMPVVQANMKEAQSLGFNSTPSFNVNGRSVVGALELDQFKQVVDQALADAK